ncbi:DUF3310 domain-containing protein [Levilactobacillus brevis]|uniref:DUF3310 domain-containing protein n=1 Tax=Levilactobacillus brevis TaxID=1580 RepID=UPI000DFA50F8|nr:DUF3310 domain-containing protein [Levilactobacillus brevis]STX19334.1 Protein of unknwon function (DUF3310) [Levilactobacillus brevis]
MEKYYWVGTHKEMDSLMNYFDGLGYVWNGSHNLPSEGTDYDYEIVCADDDSHTLTWTDLGNFRKYHSNEKLIEVSTSNGKLFLNMPYGTWSVAGDDLIHKATDGIRPDYHFSEMFTTQEFRGFMVGNIIKYAIRYHSKNGVEDLRKARTYLDRLIQFEEIK